MLRCAVDNHSDDRLGVAQAAMDAFAGGDAETIMRLVHPRITVDLDFDLLTINARIDGVDDLRQRLGAMEPVALDLRMERWRTSEEHLLVITRVAATGPQGGGFAALSGAIWRFEDGLIRDVRGYLDAADAERAFDSES